LIAALDVENKNISAGNFDEGKRRYIVRTLGEYQSELMSQKSLSNAKRYPHYRRRCGQG
jgi:hypothetical protein